MKRIAMLMMCSLAASETALAASTPKSPDATRLYVGAQLGDNTVGAVLGLQINRNYAFEARYDYIQTPHQPNTSTKASIVGGAAIALYPIKIGNLEQPLYLFGKAGYERKTTKDTVTDPGIPGFYSATTTVTTTEDKRVVVGAGVQYDFSNDFSGRLGANAVGYDHSVYITALYKF